MATVAAVYGVARFVRSPEEFLQSLRLRSPGEKPRVVRPRPVAKRVWANLERDPWEVVTEATLEAERHPEHVQRWVPLVDGAETQLDPVEASAAAYGGDVTVVLDIIHVAAAMRRAATVAAWMQLTGARWRLLEAPGATSQPRPRCVLGLPRKRASTRGTTPSDTLTG